MNDKDMQELLPELCHVFVAGNAPGDRIGIIKRGESGFYKTDFDGPGFTDAQAKGFVESRNATIGVTPAQAHAMQMGSMFGWHTPGADPRRAPKSLIA